MQAGYAYYMSTSRAGKDHQMGIYDSQSDRELEARFDDLYTQIMAAFDSLPLATWTPEYRAAKRDIHQQEIEIRGIGIELARRTAERNARWNEIADSLVVITEYCDHQAEVAGDE